MPPNRSTANVVPSAAIRSTCLAQRFGDPRFFASESRIGPGGTLAEQPYSIAGDLEFVYVLKGRLEFEIGDHTYSFTAGDAFTYGISDPHRWRNPSETRETRVLWVAVPNPYAPRKRGLRSPVAR